MRLICPSIQSSKRPTKGVSFHIHTYGPCRAVQCVVAKGKGKVRDENGIQFRPPFFFTLYLFSLAWPVSQVSHLSTRPHAGGSQLVLVCFEAFIWGRLFLFVFSRCTSTSTVLTGPPPIQPRFLLEVNLSAPCSFLPRVRYSKGEPTEKKRKNPSTVTNIFDPKTTPIRKINEDEAGGGMCA